MSKARPPVCRTCPTRAILGGCFIFSQHRVSCACRLLHLLFPRVVSLDALLASFPLYGSHAYPLRQEAVLEPGDVLYLPPLWFHSTRAAPPAASAASASDRGHEEGGDEEICVGINTFFHLIAPCVDTAPPPPSAVWDPHDIYGNKDPPGAAKAMGLISSALAMIKALPSPYQSFYLSRAARQLQLGGVRPGLPCGSL